MGVIKAKVTHEMQDLGWLAIERQLGLLDSSSVQVGFPGNQVYSEDPTMDVAMLAAIHEYGSSDGVIPSRPANRMTYDSNIPEILRRQSGLYDTVLSGKRTAQQALALLGVWYEGKLKVGYRKGPFTPLKDSTIAQRRKGSSRPLIDTSSMVNAITSKVDMGRFRFIRARGVLNG